MCTVDIHTIVVVLSASISSQIRAVACRYCHLLGCLHVEPAWVHSTAVPQVSLTALALAAAGFGASDFSKKPESEDAVPLQGQS